MKINRLKRTSRKHEKDTEGRLDDLFDEHIAKEFVDRTANLPVRGVERARELLRIAQSQGLVSAKG